MLYKIQVNRQHSSLAVKNLQVKMVLSLIKENTPLRAKSERRAATKAYESPQTRLVGNWSASVHKLLHFFRIYTQNLLIF